MRKLLIAAVTTATLVGIPTAAFAAKPVHPTTPASANNHGTTDTDVTHPAKPPTVMFVLHGTLSLYTAATSSTTGLISIKVNSSNFERNSLKTVTLTFTTDSKTKVVMHNGKAIAGGDLGIVKVRASKNSNAMALQTKTAFEVIDQGTSS